MLSPSTCCLVPGLTSCGWVDVTIACLLLLSSAGMQITFSDAWWEGLEGAMILASLAWFKHWTHTHSITFTHMWMMYEHIWTYVIHTCIYIYVHEYKGICACRRVCYLLETWWLMGWCRREKSQEFRIFTSIHLWHTNQKGGCVGSIHSGVIYYLVMWVFLLEMFFFFP